MTFFYSLLFFLGFSTLTIFAASDSDAETVVRDTSDISASQHQGLTLRERKEILKETFTLLDEFKKRDELQDGPVFYNFSTDISDSYCSWIQDTLHQFTQINPLPKKLHLNLFTLGSLASRNATFESDFEFGILVNYYTPNAIPYCLKLVQFLHAQIAKEDVEKTLSFDEELTPTLWGTNGGYQSGSPLLIATPEIMALYPWSLTERHRGLEGTFLKYFCSQLWISCGQNAELFQTLQNFYLEKNPTVYSVQNLARAMKNTAPLFGDQSLFLTFQQLRNKQLYLTFEIQYEDTQRPSIIKSLNQEFKESLFFFYEKFLNKSSFYTKAFAGISSLNIKRDVFRLVEQAVMNMGSIRGILTENRRKLKQRIDALKTPTPLEASTASIETRKLTQRFNNIRPQTDLFKVIHVLSSIKSLNGDLAEKMRAYLDFTFYLRLKEQMLPNYAQQDIRLVDMESINVSIRAEEASLSVHEAELIRLESMEKNEVISRQILVTQGNIGSINARISRLRLAKDNPVANIFSQEEIAEIEKLKPILTEIVHWFLSQRTSLYQHS